MAKRTTTKKRTTRTKRNNKSKFLNKKSVSMFSRTNVLVALAVFAVLGTLALVVTRAASPAANEPETWASSGFASNCLKKVDDNLASNGGYVEFTCTDVDPPTGDGNSSGSVFQETFTGAPSSPKSLVNNYPRWYMQPTMQGPNGWTLNPEPMLAQHTSTCGKPKSWGGGAWNGTDVPDGFHKITTFDETVYQCADHVMTASNPPSTGTSAGMVTLKPNHMVDLSKGEATISIDVSTKSPSVGDWWDIWITPWDDQLISPTEHWFHWTGPPKNAIQLSIRESTNTQLSKNIAFQVYNNGKVMYPEFGVGSLSHWLFPDIRPLVSLSDTRRDTYEVRMTKNNVKLYVRSDKDNELKFVDEFSIPGGFQGNQGVVQFLSTNYEPEWNSKQGCPTDFSKCTEKTIPATWHWDNAIISPAVPYKMIDVSPTLVYGGSPSKKLTFKAPAPANARMLFTANDWNNQPKMSFDGGNTWKVATPVRPPNDGPGIANGGLFDTMTYTVDVPQGATSAMVDGRRGWDAATNIRSDWAAQNFHIIAR